MKKIIAFAGSNSSTSIHHELVSCIANQFQDESVEVLRLTAYPVPMYSEDEEKINGFPDMLRALYQKIQEADALIIGVNEHNGSWSAFFKNTMDWLSRLERKFLEEKQLLVVSTSPGKRGGLGALTYAKEVLPRFGGEIVADYSLPSFYTNFSQEEKTITDAGLLLGLQEVLTTFAQQIK